MVERVSSFDLLVSFIGFSLDTNTELQFHFRAIPTQLLQEIFIAVQLSLGTSKALSHVIFPKLNNISHMSEV